MPDSNVANSQEQAAPADGEPNSELPSAPRKTHKLRWLALCLAGSASVSSLVLAIELRQGLPFEFPATFMLAALVGFGLPVLTVLLSGKRLKAYGVDRMRAWCLVCVLLVLLLSPILLF